MALALASLPALAHPVDELGQASYVSITPAAVTIELNLAPGDQLASAFAKLSQAPDYPQRVLSELTLTLDGAPLALRLKQGPTTTAEQSTKLFFEAPLAPLAAGKHTLRYENHHAPAGMRSGYIATTLTGTEDIRIGQQTHAANQQSLTVAFDAPTKPPPLGLGIVGGLLALCAAYGWYRKDNRPVS